jgi:hypothetical protein
MGRGKMDDRTQAKIWRYMDLAKFVSLLSSESLYFACPTEFHDPYEGFYPKSHTQAFSQISQKYLDQMAVTRDEIIARHPGVNIIGLDSAVGVAMDGFKKAFDEVRLKFGITCWHKNEVESEAMWKLYSASGNGIAIESTESQLRDSILDREDLVIADVRYVDFETDPVEKGHENYGLFLKRKSFEHEKELRGTVLLKEVGKGQLVKCNLDILITKVHISPLAPPYLKEAVDNICSGSARKLGKPILQSSLFDKPGTDYSLNLKVV